MPDSPLRSSIDRRRYRLAQAGTVAGSIAVGSLVVNRLVAFFREDFFLFYGVNDAEYRLLQSNANGQLPLTVGKLMIAAIGNPRTTEATRARGTSAAMRSVCQRCRFM